MRFVTQVLFFVVIAGVGIFFWPKISPFIHSFFAPAEANSPTKMAPPSVPQPVQVKHPDLSLRKWTDQNGRSFEGSLVSAKDDQIIVLRKNDSSYFQISARILSDEDQTYVKKQVSLAQESGNGFVDEIKGVYTLSRKLWIKGDVVRVIDQSNVRGTRHDRIDPMYWLFLSPKLHGANSGSTWIRVDEKTYLAHGENSLITQDNLINFTNNKGEFSEALPWSRPTVTVIEAKYGSPNESYNVTYKFLKLAAEGSLPLEIHPEVLGFSPHPPEIWELTVFWRTATGNVSQTVRDGSVITWP